VRVVAGKAADERDQDGHARRSGDEILDGQPEHLGQVAHGRLPAVSLPVGIGDETGGCVQGRVGRYRAHPGGVKRQVEEEKPDLAEEQHGDGVDFPIHLVLRLDASQKVHGYPFIRRSIPTRNT
jgi:hypothetical protein